MFNDNTTVDTTVDKVAEQFTIDGELKPTKKEKVKKEKDVKHDDDRANPGQFTAIYKGKAASVLVSFLKAKNVPNLDSYSVKEDVVEMVFPSSIIASGLARYGVKIDKQKDAESLALYLAAVSVKGFVTPQEGDKGDAVRNFCSRTGIDALIVSRGGRVKAGTSTPIAKYLLTRIFRGGPVGSSVDSESAKELNKAL